MALTDKLNAIGREVMTLSGSNYKVTLDQMASYTQEANNEITTQEALIAQITEALRGKTGGGTSEDLDAPLAQQESIVAELKTLLEQKTSAITNNILPDGYVAVPSIKFTGTQAVKTGVICNQNTQIRVAFTVDADKAMYIYGVTNDANTASITCYRSGGGGNWRFGDQRVSLTTAVDAEIVWGARVNKSKILRNGAISAYSGVNDFICERDMMLGGREVTDGEIEEDTLLIGKIIAFDLYDGDNLVLSYVPCMDANGVCGFWDKVANRFATSCTIAPLEWSYV